MREIRAAHPACASAQQLSDLEALALAHNAGESALQRCPQIPASSGIYLDRLRELTASWSEPSESDLLATSVGGCLLMSASIVVPGDASQPSLLRRFPVQTLSAATSGWDRGCHQLVCAAYGYANSGYASASVHWYSLLTKGPAHPGDRYPPVGAFVYWSTGSVEGHALASSAATAAAIRTASPCSVATSSTPRPANAAGCMSSA